ncbi:MAG TPA: hypothetical protein VJY63_09315, partial [Marinospirillum sp.]|nr:hypothetical protein [Marinospirillum sp.]
ESKFAAAVSLGSKFQLAGTTLALSAFTGQGAGVYAGWGYLGAAGANQATDVIGKDLRTIGRAISKLQQANQLKHLG